MESSGVIALLAGLLGVVAALLGRTWLSKRRDLSPTVPIPKPPAVPDPTPIVNEGLAAIDRSYEEATERIEEAAESSTPAADAADILRFRAPAGLKSEDEQD